MVRYSFVPFKRDCTSHVALKALMPVTQVRLLQAAEGFGGVYAENEHHAGLDKLLMHCKHFPGLLASEGALEQASAELDRTYEQASCSCSP